MRSAHYVHVVAVLAILFLAAAGLTVLCSAAVASSRPAGYIDYTVEITGARLLKTHVRTDTSCHVLVQFGLKDEHGLPFGFQFNRETPCGDQRWKDDRWMYDQNELTEVYIGVAGDEEVPGFDKAQFANNKKARSSVTLRADGTGTIVFDNLESAHREFVSGKIDFRYVR